MFTSQRSKMGAFGTLGGVLLRSQGRYSGQRIVEPVDPGALMLTANRITVLFKQIISHNSLLSFVQILEAYAPTSNGGPTRHPAFQLLKLLFPDPTAHGWTDWATRHLALCISTEAILPATARPLSKHPSYTNNRVCRGGHEAILKIACRLLISQR